MDAWIGKLLQQYKLPTTTTKNQHFTTVILSSNQSIETFISLLPLVYQKEQDLEIVPEEWICGFDAEFEKSKKVATIQVSTRSLAGVIQCSVILKQENNQLTPKLFEFLQDQSIIKVGKGILDNDVTALCRTFPQLNQKKLEQTCLDLGELFFAVFGVAANLGLKPLGHTMLGIMAKKPLKNRSTWSSRILTKDMIDYAANDAWLGIELAYLAYDAGCITLQSFTEWTKAEKENIAERKQYKQEYSDSSKKEDPIYDKQKRTANRALATAFSKLNENGTTKNHVKERMKETQRVSSQIRQNNSNIQDLLQSMKRGRADTSSSSTKEEPKTKKQKRNYQNEEEEDGSFMFNITRK